MASSTQNPYPEKRLPKAEILQRLSLEIGQLRRLLGLYRHEPRTAILFDWRQTLQRRLLELEQQCLRSGQLQKAGSILEPNFKDAKALFADFLSLESEIVDYIRQARI
jgi:hypothetical protein